MSVRNGHAIAHAVALATPWESATLESREQRVEGREQRVEVQNHQSPQSQSLLSYCASSSRLGLFNTDQVANARASLKAVADADPGMARVGDVLPLAVNR